MLGTFFQCDPDLRLCGTDVYLDPAEPRPVGIISHGHSDHTGRHAHFIATPQTAAFLRLREGAGLRGTELRYGEAHEIAGRKIELHPAGHILGSAMVRISGPEGTLLYTGDFRLRPSLTAEPAMVPEADAVIMESTYGSPEWRFPPREELQADLIELVRGILGRGKTPVLLAYSLGKAQETCAMLAPAGLRVVVHPAIARLSEVYAAAGVNLGEYRVWARQAGLFGPRVTSDLRGSVVVVPPHLTGEISRVPGAETVALTGWWLRWRRPMADHGLPLSDHADFAELLELVARSRPRVVFVTHGSNRFARELRTRGIRAEFLRPRTQMRLF